MSDQQIVPQKKDLRDMLNSEQVKAEFARVLPKHITPERMCRVALTSILKSPNLLLCSKESVLNALLVCAQAGLEPDGKLVYLIPFQTKDGWQVQVIFGYKGLLTLVQRNGHVDLVWADKVCQGDQFDAGVVNGLKVINHKVEWTKDRGAPYAYYAVTNKAGVIDYEVMTLTEVSAIRARSRAKNDGPWVTDFDEMGKKTVLRRMSKRWDLLPEIMDAIYADDDTPEPIVEAPTFSKPLFTQPAAIAEAAPETKQEQDAAREEWLKQAAASDYYPDMGEAPDDPTPLHPGRE